jgi:hypothetical protein
MAVGTSTTVVGVFSDRNQADKAIDDLRDAGFTSAQIGVAARGDSAGPVSRDLEDDDDANEEAAEDAGQGAVAGAAAGAGVGGLIGLGVISGMIPVIGPAIAGGTLGIILSNAAAGAGVAGLAGALIGWGTSEEDATYYESEFKSGKTIVTVAPGAREAEAKAIISRYGAVSRG